MPNASKYIIDVANIKPGGNDIKGLWVGNSESKYAMLGNTCIYDKVLYELSVDNITNIEPNSQTVTINNYTSKRTHGNGNEEELFINPSTKQITANTSTANTKDTTFVVNQALALDGTITGSGVTITITQNKDYPTEITLKISPNSTIPASGGTITSALTNYTYSVKAKYKSGNSDVDVTNACTITADTASVSAQTRDTTTGETRDAGTITFTASYTCNDVTKTSSATATIKQDANAVVSTTWNDPVVTITYGTFSAAGETKTPTCSATQSGKLTYTSTASAATSNTSFTWGNYSMTNGTGFTLQNATTGAIKADSRGTTTGAARSNNTIRRTATGAGSKQGTGSGTVTQEANAVTATTWSDPVVTVSPSSRSVGSADTSTSFTASATQSGVDTYTSTSSAATSNSTFTWAWSSNKTAFTANSTTTACTVSFTANPDTSSRSATITAKATGKSKEGSGTATVTQAGKQSLLTPSFTWANIAFASDPEPTPPTPTTYSIPYVFAATQDFGTFGVVVVPVSGQGVRGTAAPNGTSESGSIGSNFSDGDVVQLVVVNDTSSVRDIGIGYASSSSSPTYNWFYSVQPQDSNYIGVTTVRNNVFYIQVQ